MNRLLKYMSALAFSAILTAGCVEENIHNPVPEYKIVSVDKEMSVFGGKGYIGLEVITGEDIDAVSDSDWLEITKITPDEIGFKVSENKDGVSRKAKISISVDGVTVNVTVLQRGMNMKVIYMDEVIEAGGGEGLMVVEVESADELRFASGMEWLTVGEIKEEAIDDSYMRRLTVPFTVASYAKGADRIALLVVSSGQMTEKFEITQNAAYIRVSSREVSVSPSGGPSVITVSSNMAEQPVISKSEDADWISMEVRDNEIILTPTINYETSRETLLEVSGGELEPVKVIVRQDVVPLFDKSLVNALSYASDNVAVLKTTEHMLGATSSWTAKVEDGSEWIRLNFTSSALTVGVDAYDSNTQVRKGIVNILDSNGEILRKIPVYQMDKLALRGRWAMYDTSDKVIANINLRQDERIIRGDFKSNLFDDPLDFHHLEIHDLKFTNYGNQQPWLNIYETSGDAILEFRMPMGCGWGSYRTIVAPADFASNTDFTYWEEYQTDASGNRLKYDTEEGGSADLGKFAFLFTYTTQTTDGGDVQEVLTISQNAAMKSHPDSDRMNGFMYVAHREVDGQMQVTSWGGYPKVAKLVRTYSLTEDDINESSKDPSVGW